MPKSLLSEINPFVKLLIMFILIVSILIGKSFYLLLILGVIALIVILISDISVNKYVEEIKKIFMWLIFIFLAYIIILNNRSILLFVYKTTLIIIFLETFLLSSSFDEIDSGINTIIRPLKLFKYNTDSISLNITLSIFFLINLINLDYRSVDYDMFSYSFYPKYIISRILIVNDKINSYQMSLKLKFYKVKNYKFDTRDIILFVAFISFFIIVIYEEVFL